MKQIIIKIILILSANLLFADVSHVIVFTDGSTTVGLIDTLSTDSIYFTNYDSNERDSCSLNKVYIIYNDFQRVFYVSSFLNHRLDLLEERGGYLVTNKQDTLSYARIRFDRQMIRPMAYLYTDTDSLISVDFLSIHHIRSDLSVMENSVRNGFYSSLTFFATVTVYDIFSTWLDQTKGDPRLSMKSMLVFANTAKDESFDLTPRFTPLFLKKTGPQYSTMNFVIPFSTMAWMGYDLYFDRRTHYFTPSDRSDRFPRDMTYFTLKSWVKHNTQRIKHFFKQKLNAER